MNWRVVACSMQQGQNAGQDLGVGCPLDRLIGLEIDRRDENGSGFGFP